MKISNIKESGCNNTLMWAITNGADIKSDLPLQGIINDELFYLVTFSNVNFLELFRLTQTYRDHLRIISEDKADTPDKKELIELFSGSIEEKSDPSKKTNLADLAEFVIDSFVNIALQMEVDSDIINPSTVKLFLPMITRKFEIQIPVSFVDIVQSMSDVESKDIFNENYPNTLNSIPANSSHGVNRMLYLGFMKSTTIIKYDKRLDKYLNYIKYAPLNACDASNKLYKINLLGFHKYDNLSRGEVRCTLFNPNADNISSSLRYMNTLKTPLEIDFVVQLPLQYMQILEYKFGPDMLAISYESSMSSIIDGGLIFNDFVAPELVDESIDGESHIEEHNNAISAYRTRLTEANQHVLNCIQAIIQSGNDVDYTATFALLPSMYMTKAILTVKADKLGEITRSVNNEVLREMFSDAENVAGKIITDMNSVK